MKFVLPNLIFLLVGFQTLIAQNKIYKSTNDYQWVINVDSLEQALSKIQDKPHQYLHGLIMLERSHRSLQHGKFGKRLDEIRILAIKQQSLLGLANYHYLQGYYYLNQNKRSLAYTSYQAADSLFTKLKDTTGIVNVYLGFSNINYGVNQTLAKSYFNKMMQLAKISSNYNDRITYLGMIMARHEFITPKPTLNQVLASYKEAKNIFDTHPELELRRKNSYNMLLGGLNDLNVYELYLKYAKESLNIKTKPIYVDYHNIGIAYYKLKQYDSSIVYIQKGIEVNKAGNLYNLISQYELLGQALSKVKRHAEAYKSSVIKDSLETLYSDDFQKSTLADLQAKYDSKQKEVALKNLELQKQKSDNRFKLTTTILLLSLAIIIIGLILYYRLFKAKKSLELLRREREKFFTIIAHDLRSPLNTYQQYSQILKHFINTQQFQKLNATLQQFEFIGLNLSLLLNTLLEWSITEVNSKNVSVSTINIKIFLENILPVYRQMADFKNIFLKEQITETEIKVDVNAFSVVIRNILDNAIKYSDEESEIEIKTIHDKKDNLVMKVSNQNNKITLEQKEKIKELFANEKQYSFGEDGLGVGLILAKQYADRCHINIDFNYTQNRQVSFLLKIPI